MKNLRTIAAALCALLVLSLTGCDQLRRLAGRPTSRDLQAIREQMESDKAAEQARVDSLELLRQAELLRQRDSIAALDSITLATGYLRTPEQLHGIAAGTLDHRYYVAVGAFKNEPNARRLASKFDAEVFAPSIVRFRTGLNVVFLCPSDKITDAYSAFKTVKETPDCPKDAWVLVNDDNWNKE